MKWLNVWNLVKDDNTLASGWWQVGDYWYYFNVYGQMMTNTWVQVGADYYKVDEEGKMLTGWYKENGKWYYLEPNSTGFKGRMYYNGTFSINDTNYTFDVDGSLIESYVSEYLISFVKGYEKFYSYKYDDGTGTITQGYGATGNEIANWGDTITEEQASEELRKSLNDNYAATIIKDLNAMNITLEKYQFDALVSFAYNVGVSALFGSKLYKYIVAGGRDADTILSYFRLWNKYYNESTKQIEVSNGLNKRRIAEANIFNKGIYDSKH